jgi:7,8-dihydropterin-6-yl-methyl-4-(beta-D-ribofuranosyl)aminobenzene 5'-phosphate synthase
MNRRISPLWWPVLALSSPVLLPKLLLRNRSFTREVEKARQANRQRIGQATKLDLPELDFLDIQVLVDRQSEHGFMDEPGVSYLLTTNKGSLLFDLGFGPESPVLTHNAQQLGFDIEEVGCVAISHLHPDHMGGFKAYRNNRVALPTGMQGLNKKTCYLPDKGRADCFNVKVVHNPDMLTAGLATTGPLARALFMMGWTEEQALVARIKDKGLVVVTGCGHPRIETILQMVQQLSDERIYAIGGGLHFPVKDSPLKKPGLQVQMIWGTGKQPWKRITDNDLKTTITNINAAKPDHVYLSPHDTCDYSLAQFHKNLNCNTSILKSGATYRL